MLSFSTAYQALEALAAREGTGPAGTVDPAAPRWAPREFRVLRLLFPALAARASHSLLTPAVAQTGGDELPTEALRPESLPAAPTVTAD